MDYSDLPKVDASLIFTPQEAGRLLGELKNQSASFSRNYTEPFSQLEKPDLINAILSYAKVQELASALMHVAEFLEIKYPLDAKDYLNGLRTSIGESVDAIGSFGEYLRTYSIDELESLSKENRLSQCAPMVRLFLNPEYRGQQPLPKNEIRELGSKLEYTLRDPNLNKSVLQTLFAYTMAIIEAAKSGYKNPLEYGYAQDFLTEGEVRALRQALTDNGHILRGYVQQENIHLHLESRDGEKVTDMLGAISWDTARDFAVKCQSTISAELGILADSIFTRRLIDATSFTPSLNYTIMGSYSYPPVIFIGFQGSLFQTQELCHEVAHAIHCFRRNQAKKLKPFHSTAIDEVYPDFIERMFWYQIEQSHFKGIDTNSLALENMGGSIARFAMIDSFQQAAAEMLGRGTRIDPRDLDNCWSALHEKYFGTSLNADEAKRWQAIPLVTDRPFRTLALVYAQLVAERIWQEYDRDPDGFKIELVKFLDNGSAKIPSELLAQFGFNTSDPAFWSEGFRDIRMALRPSPRPMAGPASEPSPS